MNASEPKKPLIVRIQLRLAQARFFTFSALVHTVLILMGGTVVLFTQRPETPPDFVASDFPMTAPESLPPAPAIPPESVPNAKPEATAPAMNTESLARLVTSSPARATFSIPDPRSVVSNNPPGDPPVGANPGRNTLTGLPGGPGKPFGTTDKTVNGLVGTFYDLKQTRGGRPTNISPDEYHQVFRKFVREHWRESILHEYFQAPKKLYATQIFVPNMSADEGPRAFEMEKKVKPSRWLVHYEGRVSPPADGTYHFVGGGDDVMIVRFNGKTVLDRCWYQQDEEWKTGRNYDYGFTGIPNGFARGDAMKLKAGQFYDMEVLIGEQPGGLVFFCLMLEEEGVEYRRDAKGNPILPVFRLAGGPMPELEAGQTLPPYEPIGPIWKSAPMRMGAGADFDEAFGAK
jgi:hypothetical protein